jgi:hypothetical protein
VVYQTLLGQYLSTHQKAGTWLSTTQEVFLNLSLVKSLAPLRQIGKKLDVESVYT